MTEASARRVRRHTLLLAMLALPLLALRPRPAGASEQQRFTAEEARSLRAAVQAQLAALGAGDATVAYGFASTAIQRQFEDANRFMAMVLSAYPMLVKPTSVSYLLPERRASTVVQPVQVRDAAGKAWLAAYQMEAQAGGGWRIAGCVVVADSRRMTT